MKIYVAVVEAPKKKEGLTQFTTEIRGKINSGPNYFI
jgi:hypothetical protein